MKLFIIAGLIIFLCFVPIVEVPYQTIENRSVTETYETVEPYTTQVEVQVPYTTDATTARWVDDGSWERAANYIAFTPDEYMKVFRSVTPGKWVMTRQPVTRFKTETRTVTESRVVIKTRTVSRPTLVTRQKRVPLIQAISR